MDAVEIEARYLYTYRGAVSHREYVFDEWLRSVKDAVFEEGAKAVLDRWSGRSEVLVNPYKKGKA